MLAEDPVHAPEPGSAAELEHRLRIQVPLPYGGRRSDHLVEERLRLPVTLERRALGALLVVQNEAESKPRAARPAGIRGRGAVTDEVALVRHPTVPSAAASIRPRPP